MCRLLFVLSVCLFCISCNQEEIPKPHSMIHVKFSEDEDYIFIERTEGSWNPDMKSAQLSAYGYKYERFSLNLPNLTKAGYYPNISLDNIFYTDGIDFVPFKLNSGFIEITNIDSLEVGGNFKVALEDDFNGIDHRTIVGTFLINTH